MKVPETKIKLDDNQYEVRAAADAIGASVHYEMFCKLMKELPGLSIEIVTEAAFGDSVGPSEKPVRVMTPTWQFDSDDPRRARFANGSLVGYTADWARKSGGELADQIIARLCRDNITAFKCKPATVYMRREAFTLTAFAYTELIIRDVTPQVPRDYPEVPPEANPGRLPDKRGWGVIDVALHYLWSNFDKTSKWMGVLGEDLKREEIVALKDIATAQHRNPATALTRRDWFVIAAALKFASLNDRQVVNEALYGYCETGKANKVIVLEDNRQVHQPGLDGVFAGIGLQTEEIHRLMKAAIAVSKALPGD